MKQEPSSRDSTTSPIAGKNDTVSDIFGKLSLRGVNTTILDLIDEALHARKLEDQNKNSTGCSQEEKLLLASKLKASIQDLASSKPLDLENFELILKNLKNAFKSAGLDLGIALSQAADKELITFQSSTNEKGESVQKVSMWNKVSEDERSVIYKLHLQVSPDFAAKTVPRILSSDKKPKAKEAMKMFLLACSSQERHLLLNNLCEGEFVRIRAAKDLSDVTSVLSACFGARAICSNLQKIRETCMEQLEAIDDIKEKQRLSEKSKNAYKTILSTLNHNDEGRKNDELVHYLICDAYATDDLNCIRGFFPHGVSIQYGSILRDVFLDLEAGMEIRVRALEKYSAMFKKDAVPFLEELIADESTHIRQAALPLICRYDNEQANRILFSSVREDIEEKKAPLTLAAMFWAAADTTEMDKNLEYVPSRVDLTEAISNLAAYNSYRFFERCPERGPFVPISEVNMHDFGVEFSAALLRYGAENLVKLTMIPNPIIRDNMNLIWRYLIECEATPVIINQIKTASDESRSSMRDFLTEQVMQHLIS